MEYAIQASGLVHRYGRHVALHGPNGAGKTTLVKLLLGVFAPQQGSVQVAGGDPRQRGTTV